MKQGKEFNAIVCPQTHPLSTCSALSRQVGAIKLSDCLFPEKKSAKFGFFCIFIGFHLQIPLLSRIMKQDYIGVVGRAA